MQYMFAHMVYVMVHGGYVHYVNYVNYVASPT